VRASGRSISPPDQGGDVREIELFNPDVLYVVFGPTDECTAFDNSSTNPCLAYAPLLKYTDTPPTASPPPSSASAPSWPAAPHRYAIY